MFKEDKSFNTFRFLAFYFLFGVLWVFLSDLLLITPEKTSSGIFHWSLIKGIIFIFVSSVIIFIVLKIYSAKLERFRNELRRTSNLYKSLLEQSTEGIFGIDFKKPVSVLLPPDEQIKLFYNSAYFAECNDAMARMYGYKKAEEMPGISFNELFPPSDPDSYENLINFIKNGYKRIDVESKEKDKQGRIKFFLNNLIGIVEDGCLTRVWGTQRDITKIKEAEEAKKESEESYKIVVESMAEGLIITDIEDKILFVNKRLCEITGYKAGELVGQKSYEVLLDPKDRKFILEKNALRLKNISDTYELRVKRKDGSKWWARISGTPFKNSKEEIIGTLGVLNDITEFKLAQKLVRESEDRYRTVVEQVNEVIYQTDSVGKLIFINNYWTQLTENKINESIGRPLIDFFFEDDKKKVYDEIASLIFNKIEFAKTEARIKTKNEGIKWVEINAHLTRTNNNVIGISGTITDVHERKLAEEELVKAKEKAEESDRLKSVFLAQVSHEVRTPLNVILNYNSIVSEIIREKLPGELESELKAIDNGSKRLLRTIDLILNMSLIQTGNYNVTIEKLDLKDLLQRLVMEFYSLAKEKNLSLNFIPGDNSFFISGDEYTIAQAFQNLIDNAIKYTLKGKVEIKIKEYAENKIAVDVIDTGIGISEEYIPNLFKPFTQEEEGYSRKFEGNGLGLALTKKYIDLNNAEIYVASKKGSGSTFTVIFNKYINE